MNQDRTASTITISTIAIVLLQAVYVMSEKPDILTVVATAGWILYVGWLGLVIVHYRKDTRPWKKRQEARDREQDERGNTLQAQSDDIQQRARNLASDVSFALDNDQIKCNNPECIERIAQGTLRPETKHPVNAWVMRRDFVRMLDDAGSLPDALDAFVGRHAAWAGSYAAVLYALGEILKASRVMESEEWKAAQDEAGAEYSAVAERMLRD